MSNRIVTRRSAIHGNGVFARTDIPAGTRLIQYKGRLLTHARTDALYANGADTGHTFLFVLNERYVIDANHDGNSARWINHSCSPNCEAVLVEDEHGDPRRDRVYIEATRDIRAGDELTYNYGIVLDVPHTPAMKRLWACRCGAPRCTGTLLQPKKKAATAKAKATAKKNSKTVPKKQPAPKKKEPAAKKKPAARKKPAEKKQAAQRPR